MFTLFAQSLRSAAKRPAQALMSTFDRNTAACAFGPTDQRLTVDPKKFPYARNPDGTLKKIMWSALAHYRHLDLSEHNFSNGPFLLPWYSVVEWLELNAIHAESFDPIYTRLKALENLISLSLRNTKLGSPAFLQALADLCKGGLTSLDLHGTPLTGCRGKEVSALIEPGSHLSRLNLANTGLTSVMLKQIVKRAAGNEMLMDLDISCSSNLSNIDILYLFEALPEFKCLTHLNLRNSGSIAQEDLPRVLKAIQYSSIESIGFPSYNKEDEMVIKAIERCIEERIEPESIVLTGCR